MKAILLKEFGPPENMYIGDWDTPQPTPDEILVNVKATALNRADTLQRKGNYPPPPGASTILGLEFAGVVTALGKNVNNWNVGDKVCGLLGGGGYAEYVTIHKDLALSIPQGLNFEEGAAIPEVFLTAYQALVWIAQLKKGERILIHAGASGVGTAALQIANAIGANSYVTASKPKHGTCLQLGATKAIDYKSENFETAIIEATDGKGVDVVIDFIAAPYLQKNINVLAVDGRMVLLALMGGVQVEQFNLLKFFVKRIQLSGSTLRSRRLDYKIQLSKNLKDFAWPKFESQEFQPIIDSVYDWKEVAKAHTRMENNKNIGKIILKIT